MHDRRRADHAFSELFDNDDDRAYALAQDVLGGKYTWMEEGVLDLSDAIREMILEKRPTSEIKKAAREEGMRFLRESAVERVMLGITTLREINKVTFVE